MLRVGGAGGAEAQVTEVAVVEIEAVVRAEESLQWLPDRVR